MVGPLTYMCLVVSTLTVGTASQRAFTIDLQDIIREQRSLRAEVDRVKIKNSELEQELVQVRREIGRGSDTLFLAVISAASVVIGDTDIVPWDSAPINPGGHFSTYSFGYTAPVSGYYQFSVTLRGPMVCDFWVSVDNNRVYHIDDGPDGTDYSSASTTVTLRLNAGQIVKVQKHVTAEIYGTPKYLGREYYSSWFTGHLLYAL